MKCFRYTLLLLLLLFATSGAVEYPYPYFPLPAYSTSTTFGVLGSLQNPATLRAYADIELMYMHSFNEDKFGGDNGVFFSRNGLGFAYQNYRLAVDPAINAYTIAFGVPLSRGFYLGTAYKFMKTDNGNPYHNDHFWNMGLVYRMSPKMTFGFMAKNLKRMEFGGNDTEIEYILSAGIRPLKNLLTLSADWEWNESESLGDGFFKGYAQLQVKEGFGIFGAIDEDGAFGLGLSFSFGVNQIGSYHDFNKDGDYVSGLVYTGYTYRPQGWVLPLRRDYLKLKLQGSYPETEYDTWFWQKKKDSFLDLLTTLDRALDDETISGVYVNMDNPRLGWAQYRELRNLLLEFRRTGKPVYFYLDNLSGNGAYYLASCGNAIAMRRVDDLFLTGLLAEVTFIKGTLDLLGIDAQVYHAGKYKSASDLLTRDSISVWHEEALNSLLDDIYITYLEDIASQRDFSIDNLKNIINNAPYVSLEAKDLGLVDTILYPDQIEGWLKSEFEGSGSVTYSEYREHKPYNFEWSPPLQIAVITVEGMMVPGASGELPYFGRTIGIEDILPAIRHARDNDYIRAVVLRINSGGGDGLGADLIHRELELLAEKKPLVVSMSNSAASAGYHIATAGRTIMAQPSTVTGSIGVIYGKLNLEELRREIGFTTYHYKRGENADFMSMSTGFSEKQVEKLKHQLDLMYEDFVQVVSDGRGLEFDYVDSVAQGRVWSGKMARELRLIDTYGGLLDAVELARELAQIPPGNDIELVNIPRRKTSPFDLWGGLAYTAKAIKGLLLPDYGGSYASSQPHSSNFYMILPYILKIY